MGGNIMENPTGESILFGGTRPGHQKNKGQGNNAFDIM